MKSKTIIKAALWSAGTLAALAIAAKLLFIGTYDGEPTRVEIPSGATDVPAIMRGALGDSFGGKVARLWKLQGGTAAGSHGSFLVEKGMTALSVSRRIEQGRQTPVRLTFNNLRNNGELARRVGSVLEIDSATFAAVSDSILAAEGFSVEQMPAAYIPDTYEFYWTAPATTVVGKLLDERRSFWNDRRRSRAAELGLSPEQVHTLASIVEAETAKTDERPRVARLYLNRLALDMPLQADPTVKFAVGDPTLRRITSAQLRVESPYNTYIVRGLPPGPISIVERRTLDQVLEAPEHKYLYMCAKPDFSGYHDFAENYARHRINAARYHRALEARGIK